MKKPRRVIPPGLFVVKRPITTGLEAEGQLVRQEIVVIDSSCGLGAFPEVTCPEVAEPDHVAQVVIDLVRCRKITFPAVVFRNPAVVSRVYPLLPR